MSLDKPVPTDRIVQRLTIPERKRTEMLTGEVRELLIRDMAAALFRGSEVAGLFRHCLNCLHWRDARPSNHPKGEAPEGCYKFMMLPPPRVLVAGCEHHEDNPPF